MNIRSFIKNIKSLRLTLLFFVSLYNKFIHYYLLSKLYYISIIISEYIDHKRIKKSLKRDNLLSGKKIVPEYVADFKQRLKVVAECVENNKIQKHMNAGKMVGRFLVMHNGQRISPLSYYDEYLLYIFQKNNAIHEPQEEYIFSKVLADLRGNATMVELGSYWSFYSMWFKQNNPGRHSFMVEPESKNIAYGKRNFKLNNLKGTFIQAFIGKAVSKNQYGLQYTISVDYLVKKHTINHIDILHSDIQGYEYEMLEGARETIKAEKIHYIFISTHSNEIHYKCIDFLTENRFEILSEINLDESYSVDGLIVGRFLKYAGLPKIEISKKQAN